MPASGGERREIAAAERGDWVELGYVNGVFGVRGWLKVFSFTRPRGAILGYDAWYLDAVDRAGPETVEEGRLHGGGVIAKLKSVDDREQAQSLVGMRIAVPAADLPKPGADEYYWRDLIGLAVENLQGEAFGRVAELMETGANDVLVIDDGATYLVPFTRNVVVEVDLEGGRLVVDWDKGF